MAEKEAQDRAAKSRIITHMNNDHHDSVVRYLEHYAKVPSAQAYDGKMSDVDLNGMTLAYRGKSHRVQFQPPLKSYGEVRERVVQLDKECRTALGQSDVTVRKYLPPTGIFAVPFVAIVAVFVCYSQRTWFEPGGPVAQLLGPGFAHFSWRIQPWLFWGIWAAHGAETLAFTRKLRKHSVNSKSTIYWLWIVSMLIEGGFANIRFSLFVKSQSEKQKH